MASDNDLYADINKFKEKAANLKYGPYVVLIQRKYMLDFKLLKYIK